MKRKLVKMPEGRIELHNENGTMHCPFATKIPMQKSDGIIEILPIPCCDVCPHFNLNGIDGNYKLLLTCSGTDTKVEVSNNLEERKIHQPNFQTIK